jgi:hypothetical protein
MIESPIIQSNPVVIRHIFIYYNTIYDYNGKGGCRDRQFEWNRL